DQDARLVLRHAAAEGRFESVIDDPLGTGDLGRLCFAQRRFPAEQFGLERAPVGEGQDVERAVVSTRDQAVPLDPRERRISALVELSCSSLGSAAFSSCGMMRWARTLPSSTPHWSKESICQIVPWVKTLCS